MKMFTSMSSMLLGASLLLSVLSAPVPIALTADKRDGIEARALDENGVYTVKAGDFCYDIAVRYGVLLDTLRELQRQNPGAL
jgi:hypothetical protein